LHLLVIAEPATNYHEPAKTVLGAEPWPWQARVPMVTSPGRPLMIMVPSLCAPIIGARPGPLTLVLASALNGFRDNR